MRMTRMPAGAELVLNKISAAPGFRIDNVIVMAGIPQVMQAMLDYVAPQLKTGVKMLSDTVRADCREGDIGTELGAVAKAHPAVIIGSYPFIDEDRRANAHIVMRSRDPQKLADAKAAVEAMLKRRAGAACGRDRALDSRRSSKRPGSSHCDAGRCARSRRLALRRA